MIWTSDLKYLCNIQIKYLLSFQKEIILKISLQDI